MTSNPEWARAREACAGACEAVRTEMGQYASPNWCINAIRAIDMPEPAPDPRDAEIARLREALRIALDQLDRAHAALARGAP